MGPSYYGVDRLTVRKLTHLSPMTQSTHSKKNSRISLPLRNSLYQSRLTYLSNEKNIHVAFSRDPNPSISHVSLINSLSRDTTPSISRSISHVSLTNSQISPTKRVKKLPYHLSYEKKKLTLGAEAPAESFGRSRPSRLMRAAWPMDLGKKRKTIRPRLLLPRAGSATPAQDPRRRACSPLQWPSSSPAVLVVGPHPRRPSSWSVPTLADRSRR